MASRLKFRKIPLILTMLNDVVMNTKAVKKTSWLRYR